MIPLFNVSEVAKILGVSRAWVHKHREAHPELEAEFFTSGGAQNILMWTQAGVDRWRAYAASVDSQPASKRYPSYSCLAAVNRLGSRVVTWKLWWRPLPNGSTAWWFSTPQGWYTSTDDGRTWRHSQSMTLDGAYRYFCVNPAAVKRGSSVVAVLHSCEALRAKIEAGEPVDA